MRYVYILNPFQNIMHMHNEQQLVWLPYQAGNKTKRQAVPCIHICVPDVYHDIS